MTLKEFLAARSMPAVEFARLVGTTEASVSRWLAGARVPRPEWMRRIYVATDRAVTPNDWINGGEGE